MTKDVRTKRVYEPTARGDGFRVLVDRLWPRGIRKDEAGVDVWAKDLAPSTELRQWFAHDPKRWGAFHKRYLAELRNAAAHERIRELIATAKRATTITLVYSAKDEEHNQAIVLREVFLRELHKLTLPKGSPKTRAAPSSAKR